MADTDDFTPAQLAALERARECLDVRAEVGLALRDHRRRLRLSQRAYARLRGLHRSMLARLEAGTADVSLQSAVDALEGTGFALYVGVAEDPPEPAPSAAAGRVPRSAPLSAPSRSRRRVPPDAWEATDLVARVRGGGRRFPAHRRVRAIDMPPPWWWVHEFFVGPTEEPHWYAPVVDLLEPPGWPDGAAERDSRRPRGAGAA